MKIVSVIFAGGNGTRFWPLSRTQIPKQTLNLSGDNAMINETIQRCSKIIDYKDNYIATSKKQEEIISRILLPEIPRDNIFLNPQPEIRHHVYCIQH